MSKTLMEKLMQKTLPSKKPRPFEKSGPNNKKSSINPAQQIGEAGVLTSAGIEQGHTQRFPKVGVRLLLHSVRNERYLGAAGPRAL